MQSSETKTKRTRKIVEQPVDQVSTAKSVSEQPAKAQNTTTRANSSLEAVPASKSRRSAKKATAPKAFAAAAGSSESSVMSVPDTSKISNSFQSSDYNRVAELAYSYWERRGFQGGSPEEDWFRAEVELQSHLASS